MRYSAYTTMSFVEWLDQGLLSMVPMANMPLLVPRSRDRIPSQNRYAVRDGREEDLARSVLRQWQQHARARVIMHSGRPPDSICWSSSVLTPTIPHPPSLHS